jgi:1,4-dihydroxy-2-naphthoyl-CoA hydrolase
MIWYNKTPDLEALNKMSENTLAQHLNIQFIEIGEDYLKATMPVNATTHQPFGLLHGGASAALAETIGSVAGWLCINPEKQACVGMEINCNHIRGKREGLVTATVSPFHIGGSTQVWHIKIEDENGQLICVSRLTMAVMKNLNK